MPPSIACMADALAHVDRSVPPYMKNTADRQYILPEPALFVNTTPERRRKFLHHWNLLADGGQEWRDLLEGLLEKCGAPGSRTYRCSISLEDCIHPALEASNVSRIQGLPVPDNLLPNFTLSETREIVWRVVEASFRFEFCALDRWASQKKRMEGVKMCFPGGMLVRTTLLVECTATLMLDWTTKSPLPISSAASPNAPWSASEMEVLETATYSDTDATASKTEERYIANATGSGLPPTIPDVDMDTSPDEPSLPFPDAPEEAPGEVPTYETRSRATSRVPKTTDPRWQMWAPEFQQLLLAGIFPGSIKEPKTGYTLGLLDYYCQQRTKGRARLTTSCTSCMDGRSFFFGAVPDIYINFLAITRYYDHLDLSIRHGMHTGWMFPSLAKTAPTRTATVVSYAPRVQSRGKYALGC
ncbi:hypothetical protein B0H10DRAFT_2226427 [Mycena sp. CBHHK59/15]|nr:hypothetical protein B0H10DRAFT_2226427 [Mycena sp. CBHHK59/15]